MIFAPLTPATALRASAVVTGPPGETTMRMMLFLSRRVAVAPAPCCAQPSGYFIEYPAPVFAKRRKTWLSGMSPVAAAAASAWSGEGDVEAAAVVGGVVVVAVVAAPVVGVGAVEPPPHPAANPASATAATPNKRTCLMRPWFPCLHEACMTGLARARSDSFQGRRLTLSANARSPQVSPPRANAYGGSGYPVPAPP